MNKCCENQKNLEHMEFLIYKCKVCKSVYISRMVNDRWTLVEKDMCGAHKSKGLWNGKKKDVK